MEANEPMKALCWLLAVLLAGVFGVAGFLKLLDPATFARDLEHYRLLDPPVTAMIAVYLPWLEIFTSVALLIPGWRAGAARIAVLLSAVFLFALASAWLRNLDVNCGCFGAALATGIPSALIRAVVIAVLAIWLAWHERNEPIAEPT